jgi:hypothetical protein
MSVAERVKLQEILKRRRSLSELRSVESIPAPSPRISNTTTTTTTMASSATAVAYKTPALKGQEKKHFQKIMQRRRRLSESQEHLKETKQATTSVSSNATANVSDDETLTSGHTRSASISIIMKRHTDFETLKHETQERARRNSNKWNEDPDKNTSIGKENQSDDDRMPEEEEETVAETEKDKDKDLEAENVHVLDLAHAINSDTSERNKEQQNNELKEKDPEAIEGAVSNELNEPIASSATTIVTKQHLPDLPDLPDLPPGEKITDDFAISIQAIVADLDVVYHTVGGSDGSSDFNATDYLTTLDHAIEKATLQCNVLMEKKSTPSDPRVPFARSLLATALHVSARTRGCMMVSEEVAVEDVQQKKSEMNGKRALHDYQRAISISREIENIEDVIEMLNSAATLSTRMGFFDDSEAYVELRKVYELYRKEGGLVKRRKMIL